MLSRQLIIFGFFSSTPKKTKTQGPNILNILGHRPLENLIPPIELWKWVWSARNFCGLLHERASHWVTTGTRGCLTFWVGEKGRVSKGPFRLRKSSFLNNYKKATWRTRIEYANEIYLEIMDSRCPREYISLALHYAETPRNRKINKRHSISLESFFLHG